jgi:hypothetical protein
MAEFTVINAFQEQASILTSFLKATASDREIATNRARDQMIHNFSNTFTTLNRMLIEVGCQQFHLDIDYYDPDRGMDFLPGDDEIEEDGETGDA